MILLGVDEEGQVVFTDSATREWAGEVQRIKKSRPFRTDILYVSAEKYRGYAFIFQQKEEYRRLYFTLSGLILTGCLQTKENDKD